MDSNTIGPSRQLTADSAIVSQVLWQSGRTWIAYGSGGLANVITIDAGGSVTAPVPLGKGEPGGLAWNGTAVLSARSAYQPAESPDLDVVGRFLTPTSPGAQFLISRSETDQQHGDLVADNAGNAVSVWDEKTSVQHQVFAELYGPQSSVFGTEIQVSSTGDNINPAVAFNGASYLVVWTRTIDNETDTVFRRFLPGGTALDSADVVIAGGGNTSYGPRVASDGTNWLIVRPRPFGGGCRGFDGNSLFATRVSRDGTMIDGEGVRIPDPMGWTRTSWTWPGMDRAMSPHGRVFVGSCTART